ncbi:MAG TPA: hypothetical protein VK508_08270 [Cyclobacteriaceae bacterium]|nr:hypothetical protein [Cyclobacteriaceae bacterium]
MKRWICLLSLVVLMGSCGKDDPGFTSAAGTWTYTTPDGKIGVDFELKQDGTTWTVINQVIRVEGTTYKAEVMASGINPPAIGSIRINANDAKAVYAFFLLLSGATVSGDFKEIKVPDATYTWPHDKANQLTDVVVSRK